MFCNAARHKVQNIHMHILRCSTDVFGSNVYVYWSAV